MPLSRNASSYRRRNSLISAGGGVILAGVLIVLSVVVFILQVFAPGLLASIASPFWGAGSAVSNALHAGTSVFGNAGELTRQRDTLAEENLALHEENRTLLARASDLERLLGGVNPESKILGGVLARPPVVPYDTLVVAAGTKQGVKPNARVYGPGGIPLGTVASASGASSQVALYSTGGRTTEGWVGEQRVALSLIGRGGGAFEATLPRESGVLVNDVVYVPGPGAQPLGTVVRIDSSPSSPRDTIFIAPYINLFSLTWVQIER